MTGLVWWLWVAAAPFITVGVLMWAFVLFLLVGIAYEEIAIGDEDTATGDASGSATADEAVAGRHAANTTADEATP